MPVGNYRPLTLTPINFSLTEGTSIPAPPDSPPDSPRAPAPAAGPLSSHPTPRSAIFPQHRDLSQRTGSEDSVPEEEFHRTQTNDAASSIVSPVSPPSRRASPPRRPSSVRKFWGIRTLSSSDSLKSERPGSPATIHSQAPSLTRRKSGSWFGKKKTFAPGYSMPEENERPAPATNGHATPRTTPVTHAPQVASFTQPKRQGPPPPALPGLRSFGVSEDTLSLDADDMFKNIK